MSDTDGRITRNIARRYSVETLQAGIAPLGNSESVGQTGAAA